MPFAEHFMLQRQVTVPATLPATLNVDFGFLPTKVEIINSTQFGSLATGNENIQTMLWNSTSPTKTFIEYLNAAGTAMLPGVVTVNGISLYDGTKSVLFGPSIAGASIAKSTPAIVTTAAPHLLQSGDIVILSGLDVMKQLGGIIFRVTVTGATTFTIPIDTNVANFTAQANPFVIRKVIVGPLFYPQDVVITAMSNANPMVVITSRAHGLTVGQRVRLRVSPTFGMTQANNLQATIISVPTFNVLTLDIDSTTFTPFAWPLGGAFFAAYTPAQVVPIGSGPSPVLTPPFWFDDKLDDAETNVQFQGITIGTGLLLASAAGTIGVTAGDLLDITAWRGDV